MWTTLAVVLWAAVAGGPSVAAGAAGCSTSIRVNGIADGGHRLLLGAQFDGSCSCPRLDISHRPCARPDDPCADTWKVDGLRPVEAPPDQLRAQVTARLAGWYAATCCLAEDGPCYPEPRDELWLDGLHYDTWNVSISVQQIAGDVPQLSVEVTRQMDPSTELDFYLPKLFVFLVNATNQHRVAYDFIDIPERRSVVFGRSGGGGGGLAPGEYKVEVKPRGLYCGSSCTSRYLLHNVTAPIRPSVGLMAEAPATGRRLVYATVSAVALVLVAVVAFLSYRFLCGKDGRHWLRDLHSSALKSPLPSSPAPTMTASVLLLHRGGGAGAALDQLRDALRAAGVVVLDARERSVLNLMMTFPSPADLLALEALKDARLLFVGGGGGGGGQTNAVSAAMYDNMLKFVRNGRLGMDYGRVFAATLADSAGDELAGLVEGRLFLLPACLPSLVEHILYACRPPVTRQCSVESQADLLSAGEQTADRAQLSAV